MISSRSETVALAILELGGLLVALYGLWYHYSNNLNMTGALYCSVWYIFGGLSHLLGLISICMESMEDEMKGDSQGILQFHYLAGWASMVIGYPLFVTYTWMKLYPSPLAQLHLALGLIPLITMMMKHSTGILRTTQICSGIAAGSHLAITCKAKEWWGFSVAIVAIMNIILFSTPTRHHIWAFSSRECFVFGIAIASFLMNFSIVRLDDPLIQLKTLLW